MLLNFIKKTAKFRRTPNLKLAKKMTSIMPKILFPPHCKIFNAVAGIKRRGIVRHSEI